MASHFDDLETRSPHQRREQQFAALRRMIVEATPRVPALAKRLGELELDALTGPDALARLCVMRKTDLLAHQQDDPPFGGHVDRDALPGSHVFMSPGPIFEPAGGADQTHEVARAFFAAGIRRGDLVHNAFSYHMTPGAFMLDAGARHLGCSVFPAGTGNSEAQVQAAASLRPDAYCGTPDFLRTLLDKARDTGADLSSIRRALVSGGALFPSMREDYKARGVAVMQCYATAEFGVIAYEAADDDGRPYPGMIVAENLIVEIVRPGTDQPVPDGEVGEVVVTALDPRYPLIRLGTGDLSAVMPEGSPCGRTNMRIGGWMGRADQRTKVKGMFVDPRQIAHVLERHGELAKARLVVRREAGNDVMVLIAEPAGGTAIDDGAIAASLRDVTKLSGAVQIVAPGSLPNDGKVIADERDYEA